MAERTQVEPQTTPTAPTAVGEPRSAREGAAESAPTAPHATPSVAHAGTTGPQRFWSLRRARVAFAACFVISVVVHDVVVAPALLPGHSMEFRDVEGELSIPVDILEGEPAPPPPLPPPPPSDVKAGAEGKGLALDAGLPVVHRDAGAQVGAEGGTRDAGPDASVDGEASDAMAPLVASDGGAGDTADGGLLVALADAGMAADAGSGSSHDAVGMIGAAGNVQAGPQFVVLLVNMAVIRAHPVGAKMGPLLSAIPQWDDFIAGTNVDPIRDTDWVLINGPSLIRTDKDAILVHYSASDAIVDHAIDVVSHKYDRGGPFDAGVPGVKAMLGHADFAPRVFLRPQPHLLAVVPPYYAHTAAAILSKAASSKAPTRPGEAMRLKLIHPHGPMPQIPESITEARIWIVPRNEDGGADVWGEGDTADGKTCAADVAELQRFARDMNSMGVQFLTHGLLNGLEISQDGSTVRLHLSASRDQLDVLLAFIAGRLGVSVPISAMPPGKT